MKSDEDQLPRKLAAILYADVAGYSRLTGEDEDRTHRILRSYLDFISSAVQSYNGRVVHYAGDAVLADFGTVVEALTCEPKPSAPRRISASMLPIFSTSTAT